MATVNKNLSNYDPNLVPNAQGSRFAIITAQWNEDITYALRDGCIQGLIDNGCISEDIMCYTVPGAYELCSGAKWALSLDIDAVICIGCVIKGETKHDEYISNAVAQGLMDLNTTQDIPIIFGVLTPNSHEQAMDRAGGKHGNKGIEAAITAIQMVDLSNKIKS